MSRKGKLATDKVYNIEFRDHCNIVRRVSAFTDRTASAELERQLRRLVSLRMGGLGVDTEASKFLEACPEPIKFKLGDWGIISCQRAAAGRSITEHFADWRLSMEAKGNSVRHIRNFVSNLKKLATSCKWCYLTDISSADANEWLAE